MDGDIPKALTWLQAKAYRQRKALDRLNRRVVTQRFQLRLLSEMGRGLSREEWLHAKADLGNDTRVDESMFVS